MLKRRLTVFPAACVVWTDELLYHTFAVSALQNYENTFMDWPLEASPSKKRIFDKKTKSHRKQAFSVTPFGTP